MEGRANLPESAETSPQNQPGENQSAPDTKSPYGPVGRGVLIAAFNEKLSNEKLKNPQPEQPKSDNAHAAEIT